MGSGGGGCNSCISIPSCDGRAEMLGSICRGPGLFGRWIPGLGDWAAGLTGSGGAGAGRNRTEGPEPRGPVAGRAAGGMRGTTAGAGAGTGTGTGTGVVAAVRLMLSWAGHLTLVPAEGVLGPETGCKMDDEPELAVAGVR